MKKSSDRTSFLNNRFLKTVLASSLFVMSMSTVNAAGLGKMKVLSALGAPFKAEVEVSNLRQDEEANLAVKIASPEVFKQAGIDFNPALTNIRASLNRENGAPNIVLSSNSTINEPLLEVLIELNWQSGRLVRQYTVLLDPITPVQETPAVVDAVQVASAQTPNVALVKDTPSQLPVAPAEQNPAGEMPQTKLVGSSNNYDVKSGDTLFGIASRMNTGDNAQVKALMATLLRNNPQAFIGNNMNKLKAGVILNTGDAAVQALGAPAMANASPSKAFSQYKQAAAIKAKPLASNKDDSKSISSAVKPAAKAVPAPSAQDQLKVAGNASMGNKSVTATSKSAEEKIASNRAVAEEKSRLAELQKNIQKTIEVKNSALAAATPAATPAAPVNVEKSAIPASAVTTSAASVIAAPVNSPASVNPAPSVSVAPAASAPAVQAPGPSASPTPAVTPAPSSTSDATVTQLNKTVEQANLAVSKPALPAPKVEISWYENIDPLTVGGATGLLALGGVLLYRRRKAKQESSEFADSAFSPKDTQGTLLTGDGGQAVDTFNSVFVSSFADGNTPMESAEVDPVAEADVYMQYGRDAHAEDILKDALKQKPNRHPVRLKLMELYASKQNTSALNAQLKTLSELTNSSGDDWKAGQQIMATIAPSVISLGSKEVNMNVGNKSSIASLIKINDEVSSDFLPEINLTNPTMIGDVPPSGQTAIKPILPLVASASSASTAMPINLATTMIKPTTTNFNNVPDTLNFEMDSPTLFAVPSAAPTIPKPAPIASKLPGSAIEFNVSKFDLNPPSIFDKVSGESPTSTVQAIETKFSLAQAYMDIGDKDGAKELLQEVLESGHQSLADQAKALLLKI